MHLPKKNIIISALILITLPLTAAAYDYYSRNANGLEAANAQEKTSVKKNKQTKPAGQTDAPAAAISNSASPAGTVQAQGDIQLNSNAQNLNPGQFPVHTNITATYFWAGEEADKDNKNISNLPSAWDDQWTQHFGGVDDPQKRNGFMPAAFVPKENPFYFALPYNDYDAKGNQKKDIFQLAGWAKASGGSGPISVCKNQWVKITKGDKVAYAQWEDVGPFNENDKNYVFGNAQPKSKTNDHAGIDVSPSVHDYLDLGDIDKVDWQFVNIQDVPDGPWKKIITTSQIYWP